MIPQHAQVSSVLFLASYQNNQIGFASQKLIWIHMYPWQTHAFSIHSLFKNKPDSAYASPRVIIHHAYFTPAPTRYIGNNE